MLESRPCVICLNLTDLISQALCYTMWVVILTTMTGRVSRACMIREA